jgi:hypothetical protein
VNQVIVSIVVFSTGVCQEIEKDDLNHGIALTLI